MPCVILNGHIHSGYLDILEALELPECSGSIEHRELLLQLNQDLLEDEFSKDDIFSSFVEPALLSSNSQYYWNFFRSIWSPLNSQVPRNDLRILDCISVKQTNYFILFQFLLE